MAESQITTSPPYSPCSSEILDSSTTCSLQPSYSVSTHFNVKTSFQDKLKAKEQHTYPLRLRSSKLVTNSPTQHETSENTGSCLIDDSPKNSPRSLDMYNRHSPVLINEDSSHSTVIYSPPSREPSPVLDVYRSWRTKQLVEMIESIEKRHDDSPQFGQPTTPSSNHNTNTNQTSLSSYHNTDENQTSFRQTSIIRKKVTSGNTPFPVLLIDARKHLTKNIPNSRKVEIPITSSESGQNPLPASEKTMLSLQSILTKSKSSDNHNSLTTEKCIIEPSSKLAGIQHTPDSKPKCNKKENNLSHLSKFLCFVR